MAIVPDDKDWTWVLDRPCPECGFDTTALRGADVAPALRAVAATWRALVGHAAATARPHPDQWSAHEYACHVRDVFRLGSYRIGLMLHEDEPTFANWDQDQTAIEDRYPEQDLAAVLEELEGAGDALADLLDAVADGQWDRGGMRSDGARFTVGTFARYVLHDPIHHVWDVQQGYADIGRGELGHSAHCGT